MRSQLVVAHRLRETLFSSAESTGSGRGGKDVSNTPGIAVEVKAWANLNIPAAMRQAQKAAAEDEIPILVSRMNGQGEASLDDWPAIIRLGDLVGLLKEAGYGDRV